jgi:cell division protein FtsB
MSALTQQLEQLKKQQCDLEERIKKEEETKQKLENESIERLEALVQPLTDVLERKDNHGTQIHPVWGKTKREQHNIQYNIDMQRFNKCLAPFNKDSNPPQKNKQLLEEEIYTTIISILKKQGERITALEEKNQMLLDENDSLKQQAHDMHLGHHCYSDKEYFPASKFS